jgi:peptidoglycan/LPS O-acetylase OafA/YrhL
MLAGGHAVSFFFVLSGFIITYVHWRHLGKPGNVQPYLARRLSRIYPPVIVIVAMKLLFIVSTGAGNASKDLTSNSVVSSFLLLPAPVYLIDVLWTLAFEILFYLLFAAAVAFGRKTAAIAGFLWAAWVTVWFLMGYPQEHETFIGTVSHPYCLLFLMGAGSARILASPTMAARWGWLWIPGIALMAFNIWHFDLLERLLTPGDATNFVSVLCWGTASAFIILSAASLEQRKRLAWPRWLCLLGDASYSIYLVHTSVMMVIAMVLKRLRIDFDVWLIPVLCGVGILSLAASLAFWKWVELPVMAWWKRRILPVLSGGKKLQPVPEA